MNVPPQLKRYENGSLSICGCKLSSNQEFFSQTFLESEDFKGYLLINNITKVNVTPIVIYAAGGQNSVLIDFPPYTPTTYEDEGSYACVLSSMKYMKNEQIISTPFQLTLKGKFLDAYPIST